MPRKSKDWLNPKVLRVGVLQFQGTEGFVLFLTVPCSANSRLIFVLLLGAVLVLVWCRPGNLEAFINLLKRFKRVKIN